MSNPRTIDRRDVSHPTNPIGGHDHIEEANANLSGSLDPKTAKLRAGAGDAAATNMPLGAWNDLPDAGMPHKVPPARSGQGGQEAHAAAPGESNPQRMDRSTVNVQSPRPTDR
jgi:hypothetical protein